MDSDDNDYHGQGLHLVSEDSSKLSPVLHPYALPKFDFDEGNLRFDSLVENEVFLGIPSQEDNQWIEDFSRGNSGIDFSSSAADSCSIPRHNNVWSEATSSESVEMLLKSVGQEDMVPGESVIKGSDARIELPSPNQMETNLINDSNIEDNRGSGSGTPTAQFQEDFSCLNKIDVKSKDVTLSQGVDQPADEYTDEIGERSRIIETEKNLLVDVKGNDENVRNVINDESLIDEIQEDLPVPVVENACTTCISPDTMIASGNVIFQGKVVDNLSETSSDLNMETNSIVDHGASNTGLILDEEQVIKGPCTVHTGVPDSAIYVASKLEVLSDNSVKTTLSNTEESPRPPLEGNSDLPTDEGCNWEARSPEVQKFSSVGHVGDIELQSKSKDLSPEESFAAIKVGDGSGKEQSALVSESANVCVEELSFVVDSNGEGSAPAKEKESVVAETTAERTKNGADVVLISGDSLRSLNHVDPTTEISSLEISRGISAEQNHGDAKAFHVMQEHNDGNLTSTSVNVNFDVVLPEDDGNNVGVDSSNNMTKENVGSIHGPDDSSAGDETGLGARVVHTDIESHDEINDVPSTLVDGDAAVGAINQNEDQISDSMPVPASNSDNNNDKEVTEIVKSRMGSMDEEMKQAPSTMASENAPSVSTAEAEAKDVNPSLKMVESCDRATNVAQVAPEAVQELSAAELISLHSNSDIRTIDGAESGEHVNPKEEAVVKAGLTLSGDLGGSTDSVVEHCIVSAPVVSASELPKNEGKEQSGMIMVKDKDARPSNDVDVAFENLASTLPREGVRNIVEHCMVSAPVASASELPKNEGKEQSGMILVKDKDARPSNDVDVAVENLASTLPREGAKNVIGEKSSEREGTLEEERSFTFQVGPVPSPSGKETSGSWLPTTSTQPGKFSMPVDGAQSTSLPSQTDSKAGQVVSVGSPQIHDKIALSGGSKGVSERKTRRGSGRSGKENSRKGNYSKETGSLCVVLSPSLTATPMQLEAGSSAPKATGVVAHSSNLPDLNTSTLTAVLFQQPFTDLQQVQLRAQIFVYGSLIQGVAPEEGCMVSAFGVSDGERSVWEPSWRSCIERLQKSRLSIPETPVQSRSGAKASDLAAKTGLNQSKPRVSNKGNNSSVVNPMIPLSSPLWNISTPSCGALQTNTITRGPVVDYQAVSPLHGYQTPASRNVSAHTTWFSQAPFAIPYVASPQASPFDVNAHLAPLQPTDTVKLTTVKVSSPPNSSATKHASPISVGQNGHLPAVPVPSALVDAKKVPASYASPSIDTKSRKRKKAANEDSCQTVIPVAISQTGSVSTSVTPGHSANKSPALGDLGPASLVPGGQSEKVSSFAANSQFSMSVAVPTPFVPGLKSSSGVAVASPSPASIDPPAGHQVLVHQVMEERASSLDNVAKVAEAKLHAEQASAHAAASVSHCQNVWSQLGKQTSNHLMSDTQAKLASAAVCIAAAASVAKAASAAAKVASSVALQAKLMADEALLSSGSLDSVKNPSTCLVGSVNSMSCATPASILKVGEGNNGSSSIISAAREAARRRVEAASAASKHAENLDAIVKAAELAAEAVEQAGKIVAIGDPLPISKLLEAGPDGYWKDSRTILGKGSTSNTETQSTEGLKSLEEHRDLSATQSERPLDNILQISSKSGSSSALEKSTDLTEDQTKIKTAVSSVSLGEEESGGQKSPRASDAAVTVRVAPASEGGARSNGDENVAGTMNDNRIGPDSPVEVFKDNGDLAGAWFSANVLSLKDGKALVSYKDLETDEGKLMEWVPLEAGVCKPPVIRLAHPMTNLMFDKSRKRRRESVKDYSWSPGDRVDAWLGNCWREGVIVEKNKRDETTLSIHFPAQGKTVVVKAWHLRPTLVWTNGEWIESLSSGNDKATQGDTPREKRLKLGSPSVDDNIKGRIAKIIDPPESRKFEEPKILPLSAKEKSFHVGSSKNDKPETLRTTRSGLQKEGPKVIFGVPKPGKKRKFMDVSKHYVSGGDSKSSATIDKEKFPKVPQAAGIHGWRNSPRIDLKEKQAAEQPKTRNFKSTKAPSSSTRTLPQKGRSAVSSVSGLKEDSTNDIGANATSNNDTGDQCSVDLVSSSNIEEGAEDPISLSSRPPLPRGLRKTAVPNAKSELLKRGKHLSAFGKTNKAAEKEKSVHDVMEPRRSNRRIQPTSRLLEGLQSSLIMSKVPSVSHDKSHKSQNRTPS